MPAIRPGVELDFDDVMIVPMQQSAVNSRQDVVLEREFDFGHTTLSVAPVIAANMDTVGTFAMAQSLAKWGMLTALHRYYPLEDLVAFADLPNHHPMLWDRVFITIGPNDHDVAKLLGLHSRIWDATGEHYPRLINIDAANGYTELFAEYVEKMRSIAPWAVIMAGDVVTWEAVEELANRGADIVKVGLGNGSVCATREKTGVGRPQLSAVEECARYAHSMGAYVCSDGGARSPGDVAKAFAAGADFVMTGYLFAGTDECEGEWTRGENGEKIEFLYHGLASRVAQEKYNGGMRDYRAEEGREILVPAKGPAENVVKDLLGGLRSACSYVGVAAIEDLPQEAVFVKVIRR